MCLRHLLTRGGAAPRANKAILVDMLIEDRLVVWKNEGWKNRKRILALALKC